MNEERFRDLVMELTTENPLAIRPLLRILAIHFTNEIPTLAVTNDDRPLLLVNLSFISKHCRTESHVKAVILHEFLHILLRHTDQPGSATNEEHLAKDAVINAIIHRQLGPEYSSMMSTYYRDAEGLVKLLRPCRDGESFSFGEPASCPSSVAPDGSNARAAQIDDVWFGLYEGTLVVDDIREIALQCAERDSTADVDRRSDLPPDIRDHLLGNHDDVREPLSAALREAVDAAVRTMNGSGIWRSPFPGTGGTHGEAVFNAVDVKLEAWKRKTLEILHKHVVPERNSQLREPVPSSFSVPVLSPGDRRAFVRSLWNPFLPDAAWSTEVQRPKGSAQIYLDVSGSMWAEIPYVVALLCRLRRCIRMPFWSFSTKVEPAVIRGDRLETQSTGGTSIECVLRHIAETKPASAVIVTDGYIESVLPGWLHEIRPTRLHAIVTRDGSTNLLDRAGIPATQLEKLP